MNGGAYEGALTDRGRVAEHLCGLGFNPEVAGKKADMFASNALDLAGADSPLRAYYVPGRIEVLGKHTDYAGGSSIVVAAERALSMVASAREDSIVTITDKGRGETFQFELHPELTPQSTHWPNYPMTVARRIARNFPGTNRGANVVFSSDLPPAAGMSSSSAMMIAFFFVLADVNDIWNHPRFPERLRNRLELAGYLGTVENGQSYGELEGDRGVGTFGGSEDHTAILCSGTGHLHQYAYRPARFQKAIPMPTGYTFAVASSGVVADKTGSAKEKYNRASYFAGRLAELWRERMGRDEPHLGAILESGPDSTRQLSEIVATVSGDEGRALKARLEQFVLENETVIPHAAAALLDGNYPAFGVLVDKSQEAAEQLLGNQTLETGFLAAAARRRDAIAASGFGGGFGGSVWAMVEERDANRFLEDWRTSYEAKFPGTAGRSEFFATAPGHPMFRLT